MISGVSWEFRLNSRRIQASNPENSGFKLFEINSMPTGKGALPTNVVKWIAERYCIDIAP